MSTDLNNIDLHPNTELAFRTMTTTNTQLDALLIYPDGSLQPNKRDSTWAFPVFKHNDSGHRFVGYRSGSISHSIAFTPDYQTLDSTHTELVAITWAIIYAMQQPPHLKKEIHTDSANAL